MKFSAIAFKTILLPASVALFFLFIQSCGGRTVREQASVDTIYSPSYANGFMITRTETGVLVTVTDPWQGSGGSSFETHIESGKLPLGRIICMSSSYVAFLDAIDCADAIVGVSGGKYIYNTGIVQGLEAGRVRDVGYDSNLNYELLASLRPDMVFIYGVSGENTQFTLKLDELKIPYMYIGDFAELNPLGKAEWIVLFGELMGKRAKAIEVFEEIAADYNATAEAVREKVDPGNRPVVMLNAPWRDTWFVPGDRSYTVQLLRDAGGEYACRGADTDQTRPISAETAYVHALGSDVWLSPGQVTTLEELRALNPRFWEVPAVGKGRVFNSIKRRTQEGGSDFWESGALRADIVLRDMVEMFHPGLLGDHELYYFIKVE